MNRRDTIKNIFGLALFTAPKPAPPEIPVHYYSWNVERTTSDPRFDVLPCGDAAPDFYLDGVLVQRGEPVTRAISGEHGWIELFDMEEFRAFLSSHGPWVVHDRDGKLIPTPFDDGPRRYKKFGRVEVRPVEVRAAETIPAGEAELKLTAATEEWDQSPV